MGIWFVGLFVRLGFLALIAIFFLNIVSRLAAPFLPSRTAAGYLAASAFPGAGTGPASPGRPGVAGAPPAGHALPVLEPLNFAKATVIEQEAARTLTHPAGILRARSWEVQNERDKTYLVVYLDWTGDARAGVSWLGISATYSSLIVPGQELPPARIEGATDLDSLLLDLLASNKDVNLHDARRTIGLAPAGRSTPGSPHRVRLHFLLPPGVAAPGAEVWFPLRVTFWTSDSLTPAHWEDLRWVTRHQKISNMVKDAAWLISTHQGTVPAPMTIAVTGSLWVPPVPPTAVVAPAQTTQKEKR